MDLTFLIFVAWAIVALVVVFNIERWILNMKYKRLRLGDKYITKFKGNAQNILTIVGKGDKGKKLISYEVQSKTYHTPAKYFFKNFRKVK